MIYRLHTTALLSGILLTLSNFVAMAVDFRWTGGAGTTNFAHSANWNQIGFPDGSNDVAIFPISGTYTVNMYSDFTNHSLQAGSGACTLALRTSMLPVAPVLYTLATTSGSAANISNNPGAFLSPHMKIVGPIGFFGAGSGVNASAALHIGRDANTRGTLSLEAVDWVSTGITSVGVSGTGTLNLKPWSRLFNSSGFIGQNPDGFGTVNVEGGDSRGSWTCSADLFVAWFGTGTLNSGGTIRNRHAYIAAEQGSRGTVNLSDGLWESSGSLYVGGDTSAGGTADLNHTGGDIEVDDNVVVWSNGTFDSSGGTLAVAGDLTLKPSAVMTVTSTAHADTDGTLQVDANAIFTLDHPDATLDAGEVAVAPAGTFDFTAGTLNITSSDVVVDSGGVLGNSLTIRPDRLVTVGGTMRVGPDAGGVLQVADGAQAFAGNTEIGNTPAASSTIPFGVNGIGTEYAVADKIAMGSGGGDGAQLAVTEGATLLNTRAFISPMPGHHSTILVQDTASGQTSSWNNTGSLHLGGSDTAAGGTATMTINSGGAVTAGVSLRTWAGGTLTIDGGSLTTPLLHHSGILNHTGPLDFSGAGPISALNLDGGTIHSDRIEFGSLDFTGRGHLAGAVEILGSITATGDLTMGIPDRFGALHLGPLLDAGGHTITLHDAGFVTIKDLLLDGGTLAVPNGLAIPTGKNIETDGALAGPIAAAIGSRIQASGPLSLGIPSSVAGFFGDGELLAGSHTITIHDANVAVLGSLTSLGDGSTPGRLEAGTADPSDPHDHFLVEEGRNLVGRGAISGHFKNNGAAVGDGPNTGEKLVFEAPWTVSGHGTFANTVVEGTFSPGESPAIVYGANQGFAGVVELELGGLVPGFGDSNHDQVIDLDTMELIDDPTLSIKSYSGFVPAHGDEFVVLTWDAGLVGEFGDVVIDPFFTVNGFTFDVITTNAGGAGNVKLVARRLPPAAAYDAWALDQGLTPGVNALMTDDPNHDGRPNVYHFAFASDPLGDDADERKRVVGTVDIGGSAYLTLTLPIRTGAVFNGLPLVSNDVDGIRYEILADIGLDDQWILPAVEVTPALNSGLPALEGDWQYRTFRHPDPVGTSTRAFLKAGVAPTP